MKRIPLVLVAAFATACGGRVDATSSPNDSPSSTVAPTGAPTTTPEEPAPITCETSTDLLASYFTAPSCSTLVRVSAAGAIERFTISCGAAAWADEAAARAALAPVSPVRNPADYTVEGAPATDAYILYAPAGDYGGLGIVSLERGELLYFAELVWQADPKITRPTTWLAPSMIAQGCGAGSLSPLRRVSFADDPGSPAAFDAATRRSPRRRCSRRFSERT